MCYPSTSANTTPYIIYPSYTVPANPLESVPTNPPSAGSESFHVALRVFVGTLLIRRLYCFFFCFQLVIYRWQKEQVR